ncbi:MAG TPA: Holliday junction resolvase RuvX [Candidatus Hydrogenedentes bacterium]|nr:Holliday junction resolvase RuvX [Candidatus Hydrogenedentota bacterium]
MEGRLIGLDIGEARTGVAVSDELGMIATALDTVHMSEPSEDALAIKKIVDEQRAILIVAGIPLNQHGKIGPQAEKVLAFIDELKKVIDVEIVTQDERFSTQAAYRALVSANIKSKKRKKVIDKAAAQQILQLYLDRQANIRKRET